LKPKPYSEHPETIGEHIRKKRSELGLLQQEIAPLFGVSEFTVTHWETDRYQPATKYLPAIISFLGYDPRPAAASPGERLQRQRTKRGWSIQQAADVVGVDAGTWGRWEAGGTVQQKRHRAIVRQLIEQEPVDDS